MQRSIVETETFPQPPERLARLDELALLDRGYIRAWDLPTRVFKWSLAVSVVVAYAATWLPDPAMTAHRLAGYFVLSLVLFRIVWGFIGSRTARFSSFLRGPRAVGRYLSGAFRGEGLRFVGHNPAGGAMILTLLLLLALQSGTGLFASDGVLASGPFADFLGDDASGLVTAAHRYGIYALIAAIAIHIAANVYYQTVKREPLISAMITGRKPADVAYADAPAHGGAGLLMALIVFGVCALVVVGGVWFVAGSLV